MSRRSKSVEDYKGLPIRFFGLGGKTLQQLGASVTLLPGGEIFAALEKKAIEGAEFSMPAIDSKLGFYKIAKYNYFPGWHQQATFFELLINKDVWNSMSKRQQMLIETLCMASTLNTMAWTESIQAPVLIENVKKNGVTLKYWDDNTLAAIEKAWEEVAAENSAKDAYFKKVWEDFRGFQERVQDMEGLRLPAASQAEGLGPLLVRYRRGSQCTPTVMEGNKFRALRPLYHEA